ncbi:MAG: transketolase [Deltaproteobacteria bacterium]|nr:transketolase [Deltaproteobacteria bacterium]MBI2341129.1 transketolase [Deltaproteobacteria bacterium]MBI2975245.1 transketolase [Deltaproteobacteria bacterium]
MDNLEFLQKIAVRLRIDSLMMTTEAGSGHPTTCLSAAELISSLFFSEMNLNEDEFILSKGHAAPILWAAYAEAGLIDRNELKGLRKITSSLEGHPTPRMPFVKVATGSLGQGLSIGVGFAAGAKMKKTKNKVYVLLGDGECAEGSIWEAANSAVFHKLDNLYAIVDVNRLGQSGPTSHGHDIERHVEKFSAFGWHAVAIDGHSIEEILKTFKDLSGIKKPKAILAKTFKGNGVSFLKDKDGWHGKPLNREELKLALAELGGYPEIKNLSDKMAVLNQAHALRFKFSLPPKEYPSDSEIATREAFGHALLDIGNLSDKAVVIDGDVNNSTGTNLFFKKYPERFFQSFIAEQNMAGVALGFSKAGFLPFVATFSCFLSRAHDQIRMAACSSANIKFIGSHAGVSIGEDGPSQMGLEDLAIFRPIPQCAILYPADAYSTRACTELIANSANISYLRTTRQKTPVIYAINDKFEIGGSKTVKKSSKDLVTIIAAGITVHNAIAAYEELKRDGVLVRILDAYSVKPIDEKGINAAISETSDRAIIVEDHFEAGGLGDAVRAAIKGDAKIIHLAVREIPRSGKPEELMEKYGIGKESIIKAVKDLIC